MKVFGRLVGIQREYSELTGQEIKDSLIFSFILSSLGNQSIFVDSIFVTEGIHDSYTEHGKRYKIKKLIKNGYTEEYKIDLYDFNFEKGCDYSIIITIFSSDVIRFDMSDTFRVVDTDPLLVNFKVNRLCSFKKKYHSLSLLTKYRIWRNNLKRN